MAIHAVIVLVFIHSLSENKKYEKKSKEKQTKMLLSSDKSIMISRVYARIFGFTDNISMSK